MTISRRASGWQCFWRWPLGHRWERMVVDQRHAYRRCGDCGRTKGVGYTPPHTPPASFGGGGE